MGLFNKLFGKKKYGQEVQSVPSEHQEQWDFYFSNIDNRPASLSLDLGLEDNAPLQNQPNVLWISVNMNNPRHDGLSSSEESTLLAKMEDQLLEALQEKFEVKMAGRVTSGNTRDFYYYLGDATLHDKIISETMVRFPAYTYEFGIKNDPEWKTYFNFLYPTKAQYQTIMNRRVVENAEREGDQLTKQRPVFHWIYFKTEEGRENFWKTIEKEGFQKEHENFDDSFGPYAYSLQVSRVDQVDYFSVNEYVMYLFKLADENDGEYDGWETSVEKD